MALIKRCSRVLGALGRLDAMEVFNLFSHGTNRARLGLVGLSLRSFLRNGAANTTRGTVIVVLRIINRESGKVS